MHPLLLIFSLILSTSLHAATGGGLTPDNTAGTAVTLQDQTRIIAGGTAQGGNLLHSFREFNVETGQTADFRAAADTQNIVSRVTGPNDSWVDGQIRSTTSDANLYLVNPNGIVMGENASLDVNGAFHATTADYVTLADGQRIYADADQGVTLTVAAPEAFGFLDASVGKIQISGSQLRVAEGQAISLVGGEIDITSSPKSDAKLEAAGGRIDLVGVASAGKVKLTSNDITNTTATKANISLTDSTVTADNHTDSKTVGTIQLQGADITVNNSRLQADNNSSVSAAGHSVELDATQDIRFTGSQITAIVNSSGKGGDVTLTAAGQVSFAGANEAGQPSGIAVLTKSTEDDAGTGGNVSIQAQDIQFAEGADISATTFGPGQGGTVSLDAENQIAFQGAVITVDTLGTGANAGDAGDLTLQTRGDIRFTDVAQLSARTLSAGKGGDVTLTAAGQVSFAGENDDSASGIYVRTESTEDDAGAGGSVSIQAQDIEFAEGAEISAITFGPGQGGTVSLDAENQIAFQGAVITVDTLGTGANAGDAGDLMLQTRSDIRFADVAQLSATTLGAGKGGDVTLTAAGQVSFAGANDAGQPSGIVVRTESTEDDAGAGGSVSIQAQDIEFAEGAEISAITGGPGQGGTVSLDAENQIVFQRADVFMNAAGTGVNAGDAGDLTLQTRGDIRFTDVAQLSATTLGAGKSGDVTLIAAGQVSFAGENDDSASGIYVRTESTEDDAGAGGSVSIQAQDIEFAEGARISATTDGPGQGGAVSLQANRQIRLGPDILLSADTFGTGTAGDLQLQTASLILDDATISSGSESVEAGAGSAGNLRIITGETIELSGGSALTTESANAGGGGIHIETRDRLHLQDSKITTSVRGGIGQGGNIFIDPVFVILENSQIQANAYGGPGGNIKLIADYLMYSGPTAIEASSALSTSGNIEVQAVAVDAGSLQVTDVPDPLDVTQWASAPCHLRRGRISRLIMAGYDAHPTPVDDLLSSLPLHTLRSELTTVPTSVVHQALHQLLAATDTTGCNRL